MEDSRSSERSLSEFAANGVLHVNYRARFHEHYIRTQLATIRDISIRGFERQRAAFRGYLGPFLPKGKGAKILDIGCGYGNFLYFLQKEGYTNAYGVDISPEQVEAARNLGLGNVSCGDLVECLERHPEEFHCVAALDVVEHFAKEQIPALFEAVYRGLAPHGVFIIQTPNGTSPFSGAIRYADFTHEVSFTRQSISQVLRTFGFVEIQVYPTGPVVHGLFSSIRWGLWQAIRLLLKLYLLVETGSFRGHILTQTLIAVARKPGRETA